ncbi:MAG: phytanoyl-CoA dioxygenase family protein [Flavobacteriales bacterium]|nr:phytanoyl-CoA dioxygenase family protein [Flavobacteriales bacterium]
MNIDREKFLKQGFLLVKNVLSPEEVEHYRNIAYRTIDEDAAKGKMFMHRYAKNHLGCLSNIKEFKELILDDRVVKIANEILGERPAFFGDSIFEIGIGSRGFHKDTSERKDPNHPDWTEDYPIIRIAFYLEDHKKHSGGLKVRMGSHTTVKTNEGKAIILPTEPGDAAIFCLRTSHAGNAVRSKLFPNLSLHNSLEKRLPKFLAVPEEKERVSIFLTYGLKSGALDRYMDFMMNHKIYQQRINESEYPPELINEIENKIDFINIKELYAKHLATQA